jgi:hypothetical protein
VAFSFEASLALLKRENIKVSYNRIYELDPYRIELSGRKGFNLAFGFYPNDFNNYSFPHFKITAEQRHLKRYPNGTEERGYRDMPLRPCTSENFPLNYDFKKYNQQNWLCINLDETLNLQGRFESNIFDYIKFSVEKCVNTTNVTCHMFSS